MDIKYFIGVIGLFTCLGSGIFLLGCLSAQDMLLKKWNAKDKGWVRELNKGLNAHLIMENKPPQEFVEEFNKSPLKRYGWIRYVILFGIAMFWYANKY
ncbi:hypothetical protein FMN63_00455 [Stappia sp. BW2]|uniref:hypothetical protein n=1 Tax=Stappia sp. BW2 TaxID=2592622 RepID=UPI0011DE8C72|nr:hypothetical protein [Stappia sp. BW2]TYC79759.1 hypothetical protein FMN63_00455 [Stappia sp. BW2]